MLQRMMQLQGVLQWVLQWVLQRVLQWASVARSFSRPDTTAHAVGCRVLEWVVGCCSRLQ